MEHDVYPDGYIRGILNTAKTIAMVGVSANDSRPSYFAFKYLIERGYRMIPVNPGLAGKELLGQRVYANLADIAESVDMVDIFRASRYARPLVEEALKMTPPPQVIWMQLGIRDEAAAKLAEEHGLKVVMNRCPKIEYGRLSSEISWMGVNSRTLTSRKPALFGRGIQRMSLDRATTAGAPPTAPSARTTAIADTPRARASAPASHALAQPEPPYSLYPSIALTTRRRSSGVRPSHWRAKPVSL
jgi:predicted CoA-binding protein